MRTGLFAGLVALTLTASVPAAPQPDPAVWNALLAARAHDGGFDYRGTTEQDRKSLSAYLANLGDADPRTMDIAERKAFFINAYNAAAVAVVLERYPVKSILDIEGAFKTLRRRIGGEMLTLDDIENRLRAFEDARIHFAIVCASKSCPALARKAYEAAGLSAALDARGRVFVADPTKNVFERAKLRLVLSKVFEWNRKEFERDGETLGRYVGKFVSESALANWVSTFPGPPEFLEYDWALNQP